MALITPIPETIRESLRSARYVIRGGKVLGGTIVVQGAKNAILPMIAAALLVKKGQTILRNVPPLNDVYIQLALAETLGAKVTYDKGERVLVIDASSVSNHVLDPQLSTRSRASILFLPVVLHRLGQVELRGVGGCALGIRRLDFHYNGFKRLGAALEGTNDQLTIKADRLTGSTTYLDMPSQTSTENLIMAGCLASGETIIENAGCEPEIADFGNFLVEMGARLYGLGTGTIRIEGIRELRAVEYTVMADRLDAGPMMMAAAITGGDVEIVGAHLDEMKILVAKLQQMGARVTAEGPLVRVRGPERLKPVNVVSWPYPGFSTDFLPGIMALASVADGTSPIRESVFEDRFTQIDGLVSLGAKITRKARNLADVEGVETLRGARVVAPDLRAGMAFVLAGLSAEGETVVENVYQIERGHSDLESRLRRLGAEITREALQN
ncbi:MAG: UDP-N-acetylglucosamine 1-carboxyvinyltransferase [Terriglobia bacterium]|jgi:UDP-N-acetylglucosamine 1-carboxyvinyltransferase